MRVIIVFLILICFTACHFNSKRQNNQADREEAELVTEKFYAYTRADMPEHTFELFSKKFYEVTTQNQLLDLYTSLQTKLGKLISHRVDQWETLVVVGTNPQASYTFVYHTEYENFNAVETFTLTKESDGKIRILSYRVRSEAFDPSA